MKTHSSLSILLLSIITPMACHDNAAVPVNATGGAPASSSGGLPGATNKNGGANSAAGMAGSGGTEPSPIGTQSAAGFGGAAAGSAGVPIQGGEVPPAAAGSSGVAGATSTLADGGTAGASGIIGAAGKISSGGAPSTGGVPPILTSTGGRTVTTTVPSSGGQTGGTSSVPATGGVRNTGGAATTASTGGAPNIGPCVSWRGVEFNTGDGPAVLDHPVLVGDVNGDGRADLIFVGNNLDGAGLGVRVKFSNGDGTWTGVLKTLGDGPAVLKYPVLVGDVDNDKKSDLIFVGQDWAGPGLNIRVKFSIGDGSWRGTSNIQGESQEVYQYPALVADIDGDGKSDIVFVGQNWEGLAGLTIRLKKSSGDGSFYPLRQALNDGQRVHQFPTQVGRVNKDASSDLIFLGQEDVNGNLAAWTKLFSSANRVWTSYSQIFKDGPEVAQTIRHVLSGDVDHDSLTDIVLLGSDWSGAGGMNIRTKFSNGDGSWRSVDVAPGDGPAIWANPPLKGDVNGDGQMDIIQYGTDLEGAGTGMAIRTKLAMGDGTWKSCTQITGDGPGAFKYPPIAADVDGDGRTDVIFMGPDLNGRGLGLGIRVKFAR